MPKQPLDKKLAGALNFTFSFKNGYLNSKVGAQEILASVKYLH